MAQVSLHRVAVIQQERLIYNELLTILECKIHQQSPVSILALARELKISAPYLDKLLVQRPLVAKMVATCERLYGQQDLTVMQRAMRSRRAREQFLKHVIERQRQNA
ncbi:MAG TPA: hypothetical protein VIY48_00295 [Candidatus Paceibacterota bacterium]